MAHLFGLLRLAAGVGLLLVLIVLAILIFEIAMFISVIRNRRVSDTARVLWIIGMLLLHPFVAIAYYFTDHQKTR